jgi:phosphoribosylamine--glycine ligase
VWMWVWVWVWVRVCVCLGESRCGRRKLGGPLHHSHGVGRLGGVKILLVGAGAREHAIARTLSLDPAVTELHALPGNPGIGSLVSSTGRPTMRHYRDPLDPTGVAALAGEIGADLVIIGPEAPLVAGVGDAVRAAGFPVFGPDAGAAMIEGSKAFAKEVMATAGVPTADPRVCRTTDELEDALDEFGAPHVVKDDGLASGKGVVVTDDWELARAHGQGVIDAGGMVVVEEFLDGPEVSLFCLSDGTTVVPLQPAQDFKRVFDGDEGPNTGGMGAYTPLPWAPAGLVDEVVATIAQPTINEMAKRGIPFVGVLFCGLALTSKGVRVIEFNARFGDPETQAVLCQLVTPLAGVLLAAAEGRLAELPPLEWAEGGAVAVVIAAKNYPAQPRIGDAIGGLGEVEDEPGVHVLHGGTEFSDDGALVSAGGRVLSVVGYGPSLAAARERAYCGVNYITLERSHHRKDIAKAAAEAEQA